MKLLLETWNNYLQNIEEGMNTVEELPEDVIIQIYYDDDVMSVYYAHKDEDKELEDEEGIKRAGGLYQILDNAISPYNEYDFPYGYVECRMSEPTKDGECLDGFLIQGTKAKSGWGPLLYDIAIEYASIEAGGLIPDRYTVSDDAKRVWLYYLRRRKDVSPTQLDDPQNDLTTQKFDNCVQHSSIEDRGEENWAVSPLSKIWTKKPETLRKLRSQGKIRIVD